MEVGRRRHTSVRQLELLFEYLQQHRDLALGRVRSKEARATATRLWREVSLILNAQGPSRTGKEWAKVWNEQKCRIRLKLIAIKQATDGGSNSASLTPLEEMVATLLGYNIGPLPKQNPLASFNNISNAEEEVPVIKQSEPISYYDESDVASPSHPQRHIGSPSLAQNERPRPTQSTQSKRQRSATPTPQHEQSANRIALDNYRLEIVNIEKLWAEAALTTAKALKSFADGFKLVAESVDRFSRLHTQHEENKRKN